MTDSRSQQYTRASILLGVTLMSLLTAILLLTALSSPAAAAGRVFTITQGKGMICEIDPTTGSEIFSFFTPGTGIHPGLAFNNTELFYTDETLGVVKVYLPDGTFLRDIAKPGIGPTAGAGLGVSATSLFGVSDGDGDATITAVDPADGSFQSSFVLSGSREALTFAGSRGTMFVRVGDGAQLAEVLPNGTVVHTINVPTNLYGLAFSSSLNRLFAVETGLLYALDPDTGALLPGYPVTITGSDGYRVSKTGAAAADEVWAPAACGDGEVNSERETCDPPGTTVTNGATCRQDCTFCGDGVVDQGEACDAGNANSDNTPNACRTDCTAPRCGDGVVDQGEECDDANANDADGCTQQCVSGGCGDGIVQASRLEDCEPPGVGACDDECHLIELCHNLIDDDRNSLVDCEDSSCGCLPIEKDPGMIRFGAPGSGKDFFTVHGDLHPATTMNPATDAIGIMLSNANSVLFEAHIPKGGMKQISAARFRFRDTVAKVAHNGLWSLEIRVRAAGSYVVVAKAYDNLAAATEALMTVQIHIGDDGFVNTSTWQRTRSGWKLELPGE